MTLLELLRKRHGLTWPPAPSDFDTDLNAEDAMNQSVANVPTANGSRYLQQLCKHWQHSLELEFTPERAMIHFPRDARGADWPADGLVFMTAKPDILEVRIEASNADHLVALQGAVARHLDRFAFREAPLSFEWH
jgi:hypothetical protein